MSEQVLFSIIESPSHPNFSEVYKNLGFNEQRFTTMRKAITSLKKIRPNVIVAEFFYGFGNNYAGVNVSNLDVFLHSMQKYAPDAKVIVIVNKQEKQYVSKLSDLFLLHKVLIHPVSQVEIENALHF